MMEAYRSQDMISDDRFTGGRADRFPENIHDLGFEDPKPPIYGKDVPASDNCNLIINYLPHDIDDVTLRNVFAEHGEISVAKVVKDKTTKKSLGYGFVRYMRYQDACDAIQHKNGLNIGHKRIKVSIARPPSDEIRNCKLYVTNLPKDYSDDEVNSLFSQFGEIIECRVLKDRNMKGNRGVAFVQFNLRSQADNALVLNGSRPPGGDRNLVVKYAEDQLKKAERQFVSNALMGDNGMDMMGQMQQDAYYSPMRPSGMHMQMGQVMQPIGSNMYMQSQGLMYSAGNDGPRSGMKDQHHMHANGSHSMASIGRSHNTLSPIGTQWGYSADMNGMMYGTTVQDGLMGVQQNVRGGSRQSFSMGYGSQSMNHHQMNDLDRDMYMSGSRREGRSMSLQMSRPDYSFNSISDVRAQHEARHRSSAKQSKMQSPHDVPSRNMRGKNGGHDISMAVKGGDMKREHTAEREGHGQKVSVLKAGNEIAPSKEAEHTGSVHLVISNLPYHADVALLHDLLAPYGRILSAKVEMEEKDTSGKAKSGSKRSGRGQVQIASLAAAKSARDALTGSVLREGGAPLHVEIDYPGMGPGMGSNHPGMGSNGEEA